MPTASKSTQNPKLQKCEPCQAKLKFQEAYRAVRVLSERCGHLITDEARQNSIQLMIDAMPYRKAVYFEAAKEAWHNRTYRHVFESFDAESRAIIRRDRCIVKGLMPEQSLAMRQEEACF